MYINGNIDFDLYLKLHHNEYKKDNAVTVYEIGLRQCCGSGFFLARSGSVCLDPDPT